MVCLTLRTEYYDYGNGAGIAQSVYRAGCELDDRDSIPSFGREGIFSLRHRIQTGSEGLSSLLSNGYRLIFPRR